MYGLNWRTVYVYTNMFLWLLFIEIAKQTETSKGNIVHIYSYHIHGDIHDGCLRNLLLSRRKHNSSAEIEVLISYAVVH